MRANKSIIDFYAGAGPDHQGRYLTEILKWSDDQLESVHDYIQWLFPLPERSGFNMNAPVLDERTIQEFRVRPDLQRNLRAGEHEGRRQTERRADASTGKALSDMPALKPYRGKLAVRNFRGSDGNVGIIRSPLRAIALPDQSSGYYYFDCPLLAVTWCS